MPIKFLNDVAVDSSVLYVDTINNRVGVGTSSPSETFTLQTQGDGLGNEGIFIKNPFAGTTPIVNSKSPFLSLATSTTSAYNSTIYMGRNATATDQESKIEWSNANNGLSIYVKGTGTYREHVRFGNISSGVPRTYFGGNVGIGTTSPAHKLHVVGNTKIEGVVIVNSANSSLYIGDSNTGQSSTSTGDRNVVIGPSAFRSNTSAKYNTAVGHAAMQDTTTGNYNSVLGNQALRDNIDGDFNVAVGNQTMAFTTNSSNNTAVGYRALYQAQSDSNTAIGQGAFNSLQSSTSSGGNTGIGQEVLNKITSGRRNVGVGYAAGQKYGGGNNNVVTANDSVFIGADSDAGGDNQTNQIVIGYNAIGLGSNTAVLGNNSIVTTQLKGNVGIGTTSPLTKLQVGDGTTDDAIRSYFNDGSYTEMRGYGLQFSRAFSYIRPNADNTKSLYLGSNVAQWYALSIDATTTTFNTNGSENMRITSTGNVGIGTTNPTQKLHVAGNARVTGAYYDSNNSPGTANQVLVSTVTGTDWVDGSAIPGVPDGSGTAGKIVMWQDSDTLTDSKITQTAGDETNYVDIDFANVEDLTITGDNGFSTFTVNNFDAVNFSGIENNFNVGSSALRIAIGDSSMSLGTTTADSDTLTVGYTSTRFIGTGNVGIGTTSPVAKLEVEGGDHLLQLSTTSSTGSPYLSFNQAGTRRSFIQHADGGDTLKIASEYGGIGFFTGTSGTETQKITIQSGGNVGINTTNPNQKLTIKGNDNYVATEQTNYVWGGTNTIGVRMGTSTAGVLDFRRWDGGVTHGTAAITQVTSDGGWGLDFRVDNKSTNTSATTSRMFLSTSGEVGIGTRNPSEKLHVYNGSAYITPIVYAANQNDWVIKTGAYNNTAFDQGLKIKSTSGGTSYMAFETTSAVETMVLRSGKVGIGTTSPIAKLHVSGSQQFILIESTANSDATYRSKTTLGYYGSGTGIGSATNCWNVYDFNAGSERMRIDSSGNVGIGTTSPQALLNLASDTSGLRIGNSANSNYYDIQRSNATGYLDFKGNQTTYSRYRFFTNSTNQVFTILNNGNTGIGITAPTVKLHIGSASNSGSSTEEFRIQTATGSGYGGNAVVNLNTGAFGKSGIYFGNNGVLSYANQDAFLEYDDYSGQTKLNFGNTLTINKGTSSAIYIDSFGRVGLGTTSPQYQLQLSTNSAAKPTSSSWTVVSDERVKTNIRPYETGLQELLQIEPKLFDYNGKAGFDATTKNNIGVIAQEIKDVMPETVKKYNAKLNEEDEEDTELYNFDSHALTFALINSVKELNAKIKNLETKIQTLENK
jgi:hypothetical protein